MKYTIILTAKLTKKFVTASKFGNDCNLVLVADRPKSSFSEVTTGEPMTELEDPRSEFFQRKKRQNQYSKISCNTSSFP